MTPSKAAPKEKKRPKAQAKAGQPLMYPRRNLPKPNAHDQEAERKQAADAEKSSSSSELLDTRAPAAAVNKKVAPSEKEVLALNRMVVQHCCLRCPPPCSVPHHVAGRAKVDGAR